MGFACPTCHASLSEEVLAQSDTGLNTCPNCNNPLSNPGATHELSPTFPPLAEGLRYSLEVLDGFEPGRVYPIAKTKITIGRRDCDIVFDDPEISRRHVTVAVDGECAQLQDLGSTNGTYIDGVRVEQGRLLDRSTFRLGTHQLIFKVIKS